MVEVLLMTDVAKLGKSGDVVKVAPGYARNYLFPQKLAAQVTEASRRRLKKIEEARAKATAEADRIVEAARENIEYEKLKAMHELKNQIANLSIEIAEKLIRAELSDKPKADALIQKELELMKLN